jgi:hypothetical protein
MRSQLLSSQRNSVGVASEQHRGSNARQGTRCASLLAYLLLGALIWVMGDGSIQSTRAQTPSKPGVPRIDLDPDAGVKRAPVASFTWSVPDRYSSSWAAWHSPSGSYDDSYVHPRKWSIMLDACGSSGAGEKIAAYDWTIRGVTDPNVNIHRRVTGCKLSLRSWLPSLGEYAVTLVIQTTSGATAPVTRPVEIKDWLIVSIGDSFSSGEGNPDTPGAYTLVPHDPLWGDVPTCLGKVLGRVKRAVWKDRRCHRSALSSPAIAASRIESADNQSSVTFLSFACSGAKTEHLTSNRYQGQEPRGTEDSGLVPQIQAVKAAIGDRPIDALLMTIGINDLDFSDVVTACGHPLDGFLDKIWTSAANDCFQAGFQARLDKLAGHYKDVAAKLKSELKVKEVYISAYPVNILESSSGERSVCECLNIDGLGINPNEFNYLGFGGRQLNSTIASSAREHHWNYVNGATDRFQGRGYCASDERRFFVRIVESVQRQGPVHGGLHPNARGHQEVGDLLFRAVQVGADIRPWKRVTVTFDRVRVGKFEGTTERLLATFAIRQRLKQPFQGYLSAVDISPLYESSSTDELPTGRWVDLPAGQYRYSFDIYRSPVPLQYVTDFDIDIVGNGINRGIASVASLADLGEGTHTTVTPPEQARSFGVEYTISITDPKPSRE